MNVDNLNKQEAALVERLVRIQSDEEFVFFTLLEAIEKDMVSRCIDFIDSNEKIDEYDISEFLGE